MLPYPVAWQPMLKYQLWFFPFFFLSPFIFDNCTKHNIMMLYELATATATIPCLFNRSVSLADNFFLLPSSSFPLPLKISPSCVYIHLPFILSLFIFICIITLIPCRIGLVDDCYRQLMDDD